MHSCHGNSADHCCWFGGKLCPYLEENTMPGRRWACGLMREHEGDWDRVLADSRYVRNVVPLLEKFVWPHYEEKLNCKTWPTEGCDCAH